MDELTRFLQGPPAVLVKRNLLRGQQGSAAFKSYNTTEFDVQDIELGPAPGFPYSNWFHILALQNEEDTLVERF